MKAVSQLSFLMIVTLFLTLTFTNRAHGKVNHSSPGPDNLLSFSADQVGEGEIRNFVNLVYSGEISVRDALRFFNSLDYEQQQIVADFMAGNAKVDLIDWKNEWHTASADSPTLLLSGGTYDVQMPGITHTLVPPNAVWASGRWADNNCDSDPNDGEHIIYYSGIDASNPSGLRWTTIQAPVALAFQLAYGGKISTFGYNSNEARMCIGNGTLAVIGLGSASYGADVVYASTYITPNN